MPVERKKSFSPQAAVAETVVQRERPALDRAPIRDTGLSLPESFEELRDSGLALPLEYVGCGWVLLVLTDISRLESVFVRGSTLHRRWEDSQLQRRGGISPECPIGYILVRCPNGSCLFAKILSFESPIPESLLPEEPHTYRRYPLR